MKWLEFMGVWGISALLGRGMVLGLILLFFRVKGQRFYFNADSWDQWFLSLSTKRFLGSIGAAYGLVLLISSVAAYGMFVQLKFPHALGFTLLLAAFRLTGTGLEYRRGGRDKLLQKLDRIRRTIQK